MVYCPVCGSAAASDREEQQGAACCRHTRFMTPNLTLKNDFCWYTLAAVTHTCREREKERERERERETAMCLC